MFENIIGNKKVIDTLKHDIINDLLPPAILLTGKEFGGKFTVALEIARSITCKMKRNWNCNCKSCSQNRTLNFPDLLIIGNRNCTLEIKAGADVLLKNKTLSSYYLFVRAIRKLTSRFDYRLFEPNDPAFIKASSIIPDIEESLFSLNKDEIEHYDDKKLETIVSSLVKKGEKLQEECMYDSIPVSVVRSVISYLHLKAQDERKIVIIENANKMQESARNAFLKIIEEPPSYVNFILTSCNKNAIMPTILSRVRHYIFPKRSEKEDVEILDRIFKKEKIEHIDNFPLLASFFYNYLPVPYVEIYNCATLFWKSVLNNKNLNILRFSSLKKVIEKKDNLSFEKETSISSIVNALNKCKPSIIYHLFLFSIIHLLNEVIVIGEFSPLEVEAYKEVLIAVKDAKTKVEFFNMNVQNVLDELQERLGKIFL